MVLTQSFLRRLACQGLRFVIALAVAALPLLAQNRIERVVVGSEDRASLTFDVDYDYSGDHGANVFMSVVMAQDGKPSAYYAHTPGRVQQGRHRVRVGVGVSQGAPAIFSTNQIQVSMYVGGGESFLQAGFSFPKTWSQPSAAVPPVLRAVGPLRLATEAKTPVATTVAPAGGATLRRILPNGRVELRRPDGMIEERFRGGKTITRPDGSKQTVLYSSVQPPTPPSAPPDQAHAAWLQAESDRLLSVIRTLVDNDDASVQHYLSQEGSNMSPYQQVSSRTQAVYMLVQP